MKRALVVDDLIAYRLSLEWELESLGYEVDGVSNGDEALGMLERVSYDVVFLEWLIPGIDSNGLTRWICGEFPNLPVLVSSNDTQASIQQDAIKSGVKRFLPKPLDTAHLKQVLSELDLL